MNVTNHETATRRKPAMRPKRVQAQPASTRQTHPTERPADSSRPEVSIFLEWLASSPMSEDPFHPTR